MGDIETSSDSLVHITASRGHSFITSILSKYGVPTERCRMIADSLILADLRGVDTHGINRLSGYITRIEHGVLDPSPSLSFTMKTPIMAHLDAKNTFGFVGGCMAVDKGIEIASTFGFGIVAVKNSNHYGMGATYCLRAIEKGYGCIALTNASKAMPAWGGKEPLLGTSPFAVGIPGGDMGDFVLDMSFSVAARGKIRKAARRGEPIPEGYALDENGAPTTDAEAALRGVVLPIGGPKGSGLAMMMDIFGGLMTGANFAGGVNDQYNNLGDPQGVGHWFMVFKPEMFLNGKDECEERMDVLMEKVRGSEKAAGVKRIFTPGERGSMIEKNRKSEGIPLTRGEVDSLHELARQAGSDAMLY